jgi:hypothetical protein
MIGYGQGDSLRFTKLGKITGRIAIPAIHNIAPMRGESHLRQLRGAQFGLVADFAASLAGL